MPTPKIVSATVKRRADTVALTWEIDGDLEDPSLSGWMLATFLTGAEDGPIHQYGFRHQDGRVTDVFVFDHVGAKNQYLQVAPHRSGSTWTAVFPAGEDVAQTGTFEAALGFEEPKSGNESQVTGTF